MARVEYAKRDGDGPPRSWATDLQTVTGPKRVRRQASDLQSLWGARTRGSATVGGLVLEPGAAAAGGASGVVVVAGEG
jgi:hypothetical protein